MNDIERLEEKVDKLHDKLEQLEGQVNSNKVRFRRLTDDFNDMRYELNGIENELENISRRPPE